MPTRRTSLFPSRNSQRIRTSVAMQTGQTSLMSPEQVQKDPEEEDGVADYSATAITSSVQPEVPDRIAGRRGSVLRRLPALFGGLRRASAIPMEERFKKTELASQASFIVFMASPLTTADSEAMCDLLRSGSIALGCGGTSEALANRYTPGDGGDGGQLTFVTSADLELDEPSPHGPPTSAAWQQAFAWYCACARVGGLVLARDAQGAATWMAAHPAPDLPDGRLFALVAAVRAGTALEGSALVAVHTASRRGTPSVADGPGFMLWPSGSYYVGEFSADKRHGQYAAAHSPGRIHWRLPGRGRPYILV